MIGTVLLICAGLSFDFDAVSAARFREDPTSVNLVAAADARPEPVALVDDKVSLVPDASYPAPDAKAFDRNFPSFRNVSWLQFVAYELNGRRIVAVFNYHPTATADATLSFADGESRRVRVPAARLKVFEFTR